MANTPSYGCTRCGAPVGRDQLTVKKVLFTTMGEGPRTKKARVLEWLCDSCMQRDPDFNREKFSAPRAVRLAV